MEPLYIITSQNTYHALVLVKKLGESFIYDLTLDKKVSANEN